PAAAAALEGSRPSSARLQRITRSPCPSTPPYYASRHERRSVQHELRRGLMTPACPTTHCVTEPFSLSVIFVPFMVPSTVPHPLAAGVGAGEAAIPNPPETVCGLAPVTWLHSVTSKLSVSDLTILFLPVPWVVVRSASPNAGWQVEPEIALVALPLSTVKFTTPTPLPARSPLTLAALIVRHEQFDTLGQIAE